jgi:hypothetical protein
MCREAALGAEWSSFLFFLGGAVTWAFVIIFVNVQMVGYGKTKKAGTEHRPLQAVCWGD